MGDHPNGCDDLIDEVEQRPPEFSDDAIALAFSTRHADELLYVSAWSRWFRWNGCRWAEDDALYVFELVRQSCRSAAAAAEAMISGPAGARLARTLCAGKTISSVERIARADPRHARRATDFDADPWLLNTPAGVVDLRTGECSPHRSGDLITKTANAPPIGTCPRWLLFLQEITHGDQTLVDYLQRWAGYTLTGITREHAFMFLWGPGGNGKSLLLATFAKAMGHYATTAMSDVFTVNRNEQHPTHLASLRGARLVNVSEVEEGRPWAESRVKSLTGGDPISARVMRGNPFEFSPAFKLWICGNHRPVLASPDPAMRRRLHLVPLTYVPPIPDQLLGATLEAELGGILAWAIQGCLLWQVDGLAPPTIVTAAVADYFTSEDIMANWLSERCDRFSTAQTPSRTLYTDWQSWAKVSGEDPGSEKRFSGALERIVPKRRTNRGVVFLGVVLRPENFGYAARSDVD